MPRSFSHSSYDESCALNERLDRQEGDAEREPLAVIKRVTDPDADRDEKNRRRWAALFTLTTDGGR